MLFWLSFVKDEEFMGVALIPVTEKAIEFIDQLDNSDRIQLLRDRGQDSDVPFYAAVQLAAFLGCNPGGEVKGWRLPEEEEPRIPTELLGRLLSADDLKAAGLE